MNIFHKTQKKETRKLPMTGKVKKGFRYYCAAVLSVTAVFAMSTTAFAASDPLTVVNNLSDFIFGFIRAIGLILLGFGIVQVGLSLNSHDPHSDYGLTFTQTTLRGVPEKQFRDAPFFFIRRCYEIE